MNKKILNQIAGVSFKRYRQFYKQSIPVREKRAILKSIETANQENNLAYGLLPDGKLGYFFIFRKTFMGEFHEHFFHVSSCYCLPPVRRQFYAHLKRCAKAMKEETKKVEKVRRVAIEISAEDIVSRKYFEKQGILTYIELLGNTKKSLAILRSKQLDNPDIKIALIEKKDINRLVELDRESHIKDKTSRMHTLFKRADAKKGMRKFYQGLLKNKSLLVAKERGKLVGDIGYFLDKKRKLGLIAAIFVARDSQGKGVSRLLYQRVLREFEKQKLPFYLGASTTERVLATAKSIGRTKTKWVYLLKI